MVDSRIEAADRNFVASFEKLVDIRADAQLRRIGPTVAFDSRIPVRIFNGVAVLQPAEADEVRAALAWIQGRDIPHVIWVRDGLVEPVRGAILEAGYAPGGTEPVMGLRPPLDTPDAPAGVTVREVVDEATLADHIRSNLDGGLPEEAVRMVYAGAFISDADVRLFTAYLDGWPGGHSVAIRSGDVSGVYNVGVAVKLRRRGIGSALTWAAVQAGRDWDCELAVLQSSEMGFGVYRRMGFEVLTRYEMFR